MGGAALQAPGFSWVDRWQDSSLRSADGITLAFVFITIPSITSLTGAFKNFRPMLNLLTCVLLSGS